MGLKQLYNDNLRKLSNEYGDVSVMLWSFSFAPSITFMISEQVLLSSVVDVIVIIFQKQKLNGNSVGDIEKSNSLLVYNAFVTYCIYVHLLWVLFNSWPYVI